MQLETEGVVTNITFRLIGAQDKYIPIAEYEMKEYKGKEFKVRNKEFLTPHIVKDQKLPFQALYNGDFEVEYKCCQCQYTLSFTNQLVEKEKQFAVSLQERELVLSKHKELTLKTENEEVRVLDKNETDSASSSVVMIKQNCSKCNQTYIVLLKIKMGKFADWRQAAQCPRLKIWDILALK